MTDHIDHRGAGAVPLLDDATLEALVAGDDLGGAGGELGAMAEFARQVRSVAHEPAPRPTARLEAAVDLYVGDAPPERSAPRVLASVVGRVAGLGLAAQLALGASAAAAGVGAAGAAGILPSSANDAVRDAIEVVTPVEFDGPPSPAPATTVPPAGDEAPDATVPGEASDGATTTVAPPPPGGGAPGDPGAPGTTVLPPGQGGTPPTPTDVPGATAPGPPTTVAAPGTGDQRPGTPGGGASATVPAATVTTGRSTTTTSTTAPAG